MTPPSGHMVPPCMSLYWHLSVTLLYGNAVGWVWWFIDPVSLSLYTGLRHGQTLYLASSTEIWKPNLVRNLSKTERSSGFTGGASNNSHDLVMLWNSLRMYHTWTKHFWDTSLVEEIIILGRNHSTGNNKNVTEINENLEIGRLYHIQWKQDILNGSYTLR